MYVSRRVLLVHITRVPNLRFARRVTAASKEDGRCEGEGEKERSERMGREASIWM